MRKMIMAISTIALVFAGSSNVGAQVRADSSRRPNPFDLGQVLRRDDRSVGRDDARRDGRSQQSCQVESRDQSRKNDEHDQRLHREHEQWHRRYDGGGRENWLRAHQALHERLDRVRMQWERSSRPPQCSGKKR
ncbi:MAG: hypothetical protein ACREMA_05965 [Longimicrobiales bacterium]